MKKSRISAIGRSRSRASVGRSTLFRKSLKPFWLRFSLLRNQFCNWLCVHVSTSGQVTRQRLDASSIRQGEATLLLRSNSSVGGAGKGPAFSRGSSISDGSSWVAVDAVAASCVSGLEAASEGCAGCSCESAKVRWGFGVEAAA
jgi:hypothetical protein